MKSQRQVHKRRERGWAKHRRIMTESLIAVICPDTN
jgi:hypothetical protein